MRCILVNDANLKAGACCTYCRKPIGDSYLREIATRFLFCDHDCYQTGAAAAALPSGYLLSPLNAWTRSS